MTQRMSRMKHSLFFNAGTLKALENASDAGKASLGRHILIQLVYSLGYMVDVSVVGWVSELAQQLGEIIL